MGTEGWGAHEKEHVGEPGLGEEDTLQTMQGASPCDLISRALGKSPLLQRAHHPPVRLPQLATEGEAEAISATPLSKSRIFGACPSRNDATGDVFFGGNALPTAVATRQGPTSQLPGGVSLNLRFLPVASSSVVTQPLGEHACLVGNGRALGENAEKCPAYGGGTVESRRWHTL